MLEHYVHKAGLGHLTVIIGASRRQSLCSQTHRSISWHYVLPSLPIALAQSLDALMAGLNEAHLFGKGQ